MEIGPDAAEGRSEASLSPSQALDQAVNAVSDRLNEVFVARTGSPRRAESDLVALKAKLALIVRGEDPAPVRDWLASNPVYQPLLSALIAELLSWPTEPGRAAATLSVLKACLSVRTDFSGPRTDRATADGDADELVRALRGPGAFDLLVEVAHDFRSPLASILFLAEALRDGHSGAVTDAQRSQLGLIYSAAFGLASIGSDVMDIAKGEKDLIADEPEPFSPAEVFRKVEQMVRPIVEVKGLQLHLAVQDPLQTTGHPRALGRVLLNLTTNALKFTDEGTVEIGVRALPHGTLEYYVQDTGRGMSVEEQRMLFQPFKRRSANPQDGHHFSGTGIGLSITRRLVAAMGSDLMLDSSREGGTRFSFELARSPGAGAA